MSMPRALGIMRARPRAWSRYVDAVASLLTDAAWIVRQVRGAGTVDGTPVFSEVTYGGAGGYAAKLSTPTQAERKEADKWSTDTTHTLAIASDVAPQISDQVLVRS